MKNKLQTLLKHKLQWFLLLAAILGVSHGVWAEKGFFGDGMWAIKFYKNSDSGDTYISGQKNGSTYDIGTVTNLYLKGGWVKTWSDGGWTQSKVRMRCELTSSEYDIHKSNVQGDQKWEQTTWNLNLISSASNNPGTNTVTMTYTLDDYVSANGYFKFTIPGWSTTSGTTTWSSSVCVGSSDTKSSISLGTHYGSTTTATATLTSGNTGDFTINSCSASTISVTFTPTTTGTRTATITITDAYSKTRTLTVTGTGKAKPSLTSVTGPTELTASTDPAGTYTTQSITSATYTWSTTLTSSSGLNSSTSNSVTAYTGATTQSGKKVSVYATKNGCRSNTVELTEISVVASCSTPSASDIGISPASATTIYLGEGSEPSVNQALTATCSKGNTYQWSATPTTYLSSSCWPGTATRVSIANSDKTSATATFYHEGEYTATFKAGCSNTTDASMPAPKITVKPGHIYFDGPFFSGSNYDLTKHHLEIDKSNDEFVYEWTATSSNTVAKNDFIISVGNRCINATTSAYDIGNYADLTLNGLVIPDKDTSDNTNCNHNFRANIGTINVGDRLKLTVTYNGVNASNKPQYAVKLEKVCFNPTAQTVSGTATICDGSSTNVTVASSQSGYTYKLYKGGSATATTKTGTGSALNFPVSEAGTYTVHAYYTSGSDAYCKADMTGSATVTVTPTASIGSVTLTSSSVCIGQGLSAKANSVELGGGTGAWSSSNTSIATVASTGAITPKAAGSTNITYTITGGCGGTVSKYAPLTVKPNAAAAQYTLTNNTQTYNGAQIAVTVTPAEGAGTATIYYTGTGSTSYAKSTTAPTNAGTYAVTVDAENGDDYCAATNLSVGTLTINKADQSPLTISNTLLDFAYCTGSHTTLTTSGGSGDGAVTYTITSGSGTVDVSTLTATANGSISVTATKAESANYNETTSAAKTFNFTYATPTPYAISAASTAICSGGGGTITLAGSQTGYNYLLYNGITPLDDEGEIKPGTGSAITFDVSSSGVYTAKGYYGTNRENCLTDMEETVVMTISTTPKLVRSATEVTNYTPVTITSVNTDIETWSITNESDTAYSYDKTANSITFKGLSNKSPYTVTATTHGGCSNTTTITVNADTEVCP